MGRVTNNSGHTANLWRHIVRWRWIWMSVSLVVLVVPPTYNYLSPPPPTFDRKIWLESWSETDTSYPPRFTVREKYVSDLLKNWIVKGSTHAYIHRLLGTPSSCRTHDYSGKPSPYDEYIVGTDGMDGTFLEINYDGEGRMTRAFAHGS